MGLPRRGIANGPSHTRSALWSWLRLPESAIANELVLPFRECRVILSGGLLPPGRFIIHVGSGAFGAFPLWRIRSSVHGWAKVLPRRDFQKCVDPNCLITNDLTTFNRIHPFSTLAATIRDGRIFLVVVGS